MTAYYPNIRRDESRLYIVYYLQKTLLHFCEFEKQLNEGRHSCRPKLEKVIKKQYMYQNVAIRRVRLTLSAAAHHTVAVKAIDEGAVLDQINQCRDAIHRV